ncbi:hypothetical protein [Paractinoplanes durhamensis]|uniref:Uncharacterized protein n=1 Tax=Paractinoplanes durhamensis TaxID=113563 RepID=A0ABQ3YZU6_9ACTN|nr:hypothetical protein [Actinoplanes durhamensis]GIE03105.1 hypothetical protein Adu01nite_44550 [Actinoplanes durhamensis]
MPAVLGQVAVLVLAAWQVIRSVEGGNVVCAVALIPLALLGGWRAWQISRRIGAVR